jgi:DNA-binding NarL/FixJ family response regulator
VSKQRPSTRASVGGRPAPTPLPADSLAFWRRRVFRNSYTRQGRTLRVKRWSVKLQHQGKRRTFSLAGALRIEAAREAQSIYQILRTKGWDAALQAHARAAPAFPRPSRHEYSRLDFRYWQERLIHSKYREARLTTLKEFSVRLEHEGSYHYFPLGTEEEGPASVNALKIYRTIVADGWEAAFRQFSREITVAIFWSASPVACTYTTLFTFAGEYPAGLPPAAGLGRLRKNVLLIEPDVEVRRTLIFWLSRQPGFECAAAFPDARGAQELIGQKPPDLLLVNRALPEMPVAEFLDELKDRWPDLPAFAYGIYQDSDQIFITLSGVTAGYIFRRRKPHELFEPIRRAIRQRAFSAKEALLLIRDYFQSLFGFAPPGEETPGLASLTAREQEILNHVSKGFLDKEIAGALSISVWTVHNHLKRVYEKLNVHTRTEAVLKYLQK